MKDYIFGFSVHDVTRDFFYCVGDGYGALRWFILAIFAAAFSYFIWSLGKLSAQWAKGEKGVYPGLSVRRVFRVIAEVFFQTRIMKDRQSGLSHLLIFWGACGFVFLYFFVFLQEYVFIPFAGIRFLSGYPYIAWTFLHDLCVLMVISGILISLFRRFVFRTVSLVTARRDVLFLAVLSLAVLSGLLNDAMRISASGYPLFEKFSFLSYFVSLIFSVSDGIVSNSLLSVLWWTHVCLCAFFLAKSGAVMVPGIMAVGTANIYYSQIDDEPQLRYRLGLFSGREGERKGVGVIRDFSWKDLMDIDACIRCGRCEEHCPVNITGDSLSPQKIMVDLAALYKETRNEGGASGGEIARRIHRDDIMACTLCGACTEVCPVRVNQMKKIHGIRKNYVSKGPVPEGIFPLREMCGEKTPGSLWHQTSDFIKTLAEKPAEFLFFAGCFPSQNEDSAREALAFAELADKAGVSFGVLGNEEYCCGDALLHAGDEDGFRECARRNLEVFAKYNVSKIVTTCPHCYNVLNKEYRTLANILGIFRSDYEVVHYADMLDRLIKERKIRPAKPASAMVTYHDSCLLGRYNDIYDSPRRCIDSVPGVMRIEMTRSRENSFCCGGPLDFMKTGGEKMAMFRARDINSSGARVAVTACAHCGKMISHGIKNAGIKNLKVTGLASFIKESL